MRKDATRAQQVHAALQREIPRTYPAIMQRCVVEHLRANAQPDTVYSMPLQDMYSVQPLASNTRVGSHDPQRVDDAQGCSLVPARLGIARLFFRGLHSRLRLKRGPALAAFPPDAFVIATHGRTKPGAAGNDADNDANADDAPVVDISLRSASVAASSCLQIGGKHVFAMFSRRTLCSCS